MDALVTVFTVQGQDPRRRRLLPERKVGRDPPAASVFVEAAPREPGPRPLVDVVDAAAVAELLLPVVVSVAAEPARGRVVERQRVRVEVARDGRGGAVRGPGGDGWAWPGCCGDRWEGRRRRGGDCADWRTDDRGRDDVRVGGDLLR